MPSTLRSHMCVAFPNRTSIPTHFFAHAQSFDRGVTYLRTYSSTDCTGRVGETIKRKGGVSQACLGKSGHSQYGQSTSVKTGYPLTSITCPYGRLTSQLIKVTYGFIWRLSADQLLVLLDGDQCSISYFLSSLRAQENWKCTHIEHQCCDQLTTVKTGYPLISITWTYRGLRCRPTAVKYFLTLSSDKLLVFKWSQAQVKFFLNSYEICRVFLPYN